MKVCSENPRSKGRSRLGNNSLETSNSIANEDEHLRHGRDHKVLPEGTLKNKCTPRFYPFIWKQTLNQSQVSEDICHGCIYG